MMKKSIFAIAVASALTLGAAQAETILYGSIRYDYENVKKQSIGFENVQSTNVNVNDMPYYSGVRGTRTSNRTSNLSDAGSRIGLKGSEDLGNNNSVIYQLEWGFDGMEQPADGASNAGGFKNRLAILGLTGNWGTFTAGRQENPFHNVLVKDAIVDQFNGSHVITSASQRSLTSTLLGTQASSFVTNYGHNYANSDGTFDYALGTPAVWSGETTISDAKFSRVGKVIAYTTPNMGGFYANAALMMDNENFNVEKTVDLWTVNAHYSHEFGSDGTLLLKAGYINGKLIDKNSAKAWALFAGYDQAAYGLTLSYTQGNHRHVGDDYKDKSRGFDLGGRYSFGANYFSSVRVNYGENQVKTDGRKDKVKSWAVGFEQKLSTRTRAWVEYGTEETKYDNFPVKKKEDVISIGMRHDF
ncbi:porin [Ignatzschineria sp. LJL83]